MNDNELTRMNRSISYLLNFILSLQSTNSIDLRKEFSSSSISVF